MFSYTEFQRRSGEAHSEKNKILSGGREISQPGDGIAMAAMVSTCFFNPVYCPQKADNSKAGLPLA